MDSMSDSNDPPKLSGYAVIVAAKFLQETAHLGKERQKELLRMLAEASRLKRARAEAGDTKGAL